MFGTGEKDLLVVFPVELLSEAEEAAKRFTTYLEGEIPSTADFNQVRIHAVGTLCEAMKFLGNRSQIDQSPAVGVFIHADTPYKENFPLEESHGIFMVAMAARENNIPAVICRSQLGRPSGDGDPVVVDLRPKEGFDFLLGVLVEKIARNLESQNK